MVLGSCFWFLEWDFFIGFFYIYLGVFSRNKLVILWIRLGVGVFACRAWSWVWVRGVVVFVVF